MRASFLARFSALAFVGLSSCARCSGSKSSAIDAAPSPSASTTVATSVSTDGGLAPARCSAIGNVIRLGDATDGDAQGAPVPFATEIGGAAGDATGFVVGARAAGLFGEALVLRVDRDGNKLDTLGKFLPSAGVARAPIVASDGKRVLAAMLVVGPGGDTPSSDVGGNRSLHVAEVRDGKLQTLGDVPQTVDESEAASIVETPDGAAIAWDDADPTGAIGRVHLSLVHDVKKEVIYAPSPSASVVPPKKPSTAASNAPDPAAADVVSPPSSDAAWPLLVQAPDANAAVLLWLAERPEHDDDTDGGAGEPTQVEAYRWVEAVVVDLTSGTAIGKPRPLTKQDGHAQTVAAAWTKRGLVVVVRDDPRPTDGDGGELLGALSFIDASFHLGDPEMIAVAPRNVAPGVPFVVVQNAASTTPSLFTAYLTIDDEARLVPMFGPGAISIEPSLAGRHLVAASGDRFLASRLSGAGLELSVVRCAP